VTITIGASAEDTLILLWRPGVVPIEVRGGKFSFAGKKDHICPVIRRR
jgi:hypothetical protein